MQATHTAFHDPQTKLDCLFTPAGSLAQSQGRTELYRLSSQRRRRCPRL